MHKRNTREAGFTIVELLIVIVVIAILAAISIVAYTGIQDRARQSAHMHNASQSERGISLHAAANGSDISIESGSLIGYKEGAGDIDLIEPITGSPDITMYAVLKVNSAGNQYTPIARLMPMTWDSQGFMINTGPSGSSSMAYRIDTTQQSNIGTTSPTGVWVPGSAAICWVQYIAETSISSTNCNHPTIHNSRTISPHAGWTFTGLRLGDAGQDEIIVGLVFNTAHDQETRSQVLQWLTDKY